MGWMWLTKWLENTPSMTRRWPIHSFQNTLDLAAINAWILYKEIDGIKISSRRFLQNLSDDLALLMAKSSTLTRTTEDIAACSEQPPKRNCQRQMQKEPFESRTKCHRTKCHKSDMDKMPQNENRAKCHKIRMHQNCSNKSYNSVMKA